MPHIGLVGAGNRDLLTTYPSYIQADWQTKPLNIRLRRTAQGGSQLVEVDGLRPNPPVQLMAIQLAGKTREGATVELGCFNSKAILDAEVFSFRTETTVVRFSRFQARVDIALWPGMDDDAFDVQALFTPGIGGVIDPPNQDVMLALGPYSWTIPAGSFHQRGHWSLFEGYVGTTWIAAAFTRLTDGRYTFAAVGWRVDLDGVTNPLPLRLRIGDHAGSTEVVARIITR